MSKTGHRVLVVEDEPDAREIACDILRSRGDSPREAATVDEALAAIEEEEFCYFVLDQQLPVDTSALKVYIAGGERVIAAARSSDRRRTAADDHVTPIVALTGYPGGPQWVAGLFERGITAYVEKPVHAHMELFLDKVRGALERAGRGDHAKCAPLRARGGAAPVALESLSDRARPIVVDGVRGRKLTGFLLGGKRRELQDAKVAPFLRFVGTHKRAPGTWLSKQALGILRSEDAVSRIRKALAGAIPEGEEIIERDNAGSFRLNPAVVVERVDWEALLEHPEAAVRKVAKEEIERR